jgi:hypothetical protein
MQQSHDELTNARPYFSTVAGIWKIKNRYPSFVQEGEAMAMVKEAEIVMGGRRPEAQLSGCVRNPS